MMIPTMAHADTVKAVFAGGCFWCMESSFEEEEGILSAVSGYIGGDAVDANYEAVSAKKTKHVEAVEITYDPVKVSYEKLLDIYWSNIDPTDAGGQMFDRGPQYTTVIYYANEAERKQAEDSKASVAKKLGQSIATRILPLTPFIPPKSITRIITARILTTTKPTSKAAGGRKSSKRFGSKITPPILRGG